MRIKSFGDFSREAAAIETTPEIDPALLELIKKEAKENFPEMEAIYRDLHENPELGGEEIRTGEKIVEQLEKLGVEVLEKKINGGGVIAIVRGEEGGPTVALRADIDALPIEESKENSPRSKKEGVSHGCGHDLHTASLLGAAKTLKELAGQNNLDGDVVLIFQPSEEKAHQKASGASRIVARLLKMGFMGEKGKIDAFFGAHVMREMPRGFVNVKEGVQMASSGEVDIKIKTSGGHIMNAYELPNLHLIFSEITLKMSEAFKSLYEKKEALVASARTSYEGKGYNVLPAEADATWVVRVASTLWPQMAPEIYSKMKTIVREVVNKYTKLGNADVDITPRVGYLPVIHAHPKLVELAAKSSEQVISNCQNVPQVLMGGEDFSHYLVEYKGRAIPGVYVMVGAANPEKNIPLGPHHAPDFRVDREVMSDLDSLYVTFALNAIRYYKEHKK
jgi:amidohydrolase